MLKETVKTDDAEEMAKKVSFFNDEFHVHLTDGRILRVPLQAFPSLKNAQKKELEDYEIWDNGIFWNSIDESVSIPALLKGYGDRRNKDFNYVFDVKFVLRRMAVNDTEIRWQDKIPRCFGVVSGDTTHGMFASHSSDEKEARKLRSQIRSEGIGWDVFKVELEEYMHKRGFREEHIQEQLRYAKKIMYPTRRSPSRR